MNVCARAHTHTHVQTPKGTPPLLVIALHLREELHELRRHFLPDPRLHRDVLLLLLGQFGLQLLDLCTLGL